MSEPKSITFETRYGNIAALRWGEGNNHKVLALHGWLDNAASFWHLAPLMTKHGFEITAIDFPGHGLSDHRAPGHIYGFTDFVVDLQAVMSQMNPPLTLLCHSMGAAIAAMYGSAFPEQIHKMVMLENLGPIPPYQPGKAVSGLREALKLWNKHTLDHKRFYPDVEQAIQARQTATPMDNNLIRPLVARGLKKTAKGYHWRTDKRLKLRSFFRMSEENICEFLNELTVPTQLLIGQPRTYALDYPMFDNRLKALNPLEFIEISGDHHLHISDAKNVANHILNFLAR